MGQLIDRLKFVVGAVPAAINGGWEGAAYTTGDYVNMKNFGRLTIVIIGGAAAGACGAITLKQSTTPTTANDAALAFTERFECAATSAASDSWTATTVSSDTFTPTTTTANLHQIIEVNARDLTAGYNYVRVNLASGGNAGNIMSLLYILSEPRYLAAEGTGTAIV